MTAELKIKKLQDEINALETKLNNKSKNELRIWQRDYILSCSIEDILKEAKSSEPKTFVANAVKLLSNIKNTLEFPEKLEKPSINKEEVEKLNAKVEKLENEVSIVNQKHQQVNAENQKNIEEIKYLEKNNAKLQTEIREMTEKMNKMKDQQNKLETDIAKCQICAEELKYFKEEVVELQTKIEEMKNQKYQLLYNLDRMAEEKELLKYKQSKESNEAENLIAELKKTIITKDEQLKEANIFGDNDLIQNDSFYSYEDKLKIKNAQLHGKLLNMDKELKRAYQLIDHYKKYADL